MGAASWAQAHSRSAPYPPRARLYARRVPEVRECSGEIDGLPVFWRTAVSDAGEGASQRAVPLYVHGVPTNSDDWLPFLRRGGGLAPDLPGFGRSGKPGSRAYTIAEYEGFIERFLELAGVGRVSLIVHDWGAVGLAFAQRARERIERIVVINAVPFLPGYRWHRTARIWRTPLLGELAMGAINERTLRLASRGANVTQGALGEQWQRSALDHFDHGTQRAILRLYRSSPPEVLEAAGAKLGAIGVPAMVLWGLQDPYIPARFASAYADALGGAELIELADAGHWPWVDRPDAIERVIAFLGRTRE
jgi:pimeloyl-ACP methyl ester carboxylesterase